MDCFGDGLEQLPRLRKLSLWLPAYRSFALSEMSEYPDKIPTILDVSEKVFFIRGSHKECEPDTLAQLRSLYDTTSLWAPINLPDFESMIRNVLRLEPDEDLDEDTELMRIWELCNENAMHHIVWWLAKTCPRLERFQWWAMEHHATSQRSVVWDWRVQRYHHAARLNQVKALNGHLMWTASGPLPCGKREQPPRKFPVLVGEELERHYSFHNGRSWAY